MIKKKTLLVLAGVFLITAGILYSKDFFRTESAKSLEEPQQGDDQLENVSTIKDRQAAKPEQREYKENYAYYSDVEPDKTWKLSYGKVLKEKGIKEKITVTSEEGKAVPVAVDLTNKGKTLVIRPPTAGYQKGGIYRLYVDESIPYADGQSLTSGYTIEFAIKRDEVEKIVMNPELVTVNTEAVIKKEGNRLELHSKYLDEEIKKDDILLLPTQLPYIKQKAEQVVAVQRENNRYILEVARPEFFELFEELNIYKKYSLADDNAIVIPAEGVEYKKFSLHQPNTLISSFHATTEQPLEHKVEEKPLQRGRNGAIELKLKSVSVPVQGFNFTLNGKINLKEPSIVTDIDAGFIRGIDRLNIVVNSRQESTIDLALPANFNYSQFKENTSKKSKNNIPIGRILYPTPVPGVFFDTNIYLSHRSLISSIKEMKEGRASGELRVTLNAGVSEKIGVKKDQSGDYDSIFEVKGDSDSVYQLAASGEFKAGPKLSMGLSAYGVVGLGLAGSVGGFVEGTGYLTILEKSRQSQLTKEGFDINPLCAKTEFGLFAGAYTVVDLLNVPVLDYEIAESRRAIQQTNSCIAFGSIKTDPERIEANPGDEIDIEVNGTYFDGETGSLMEKNHLTSKELVEQLEVSFSDPYITNIEVKQRKENEYVLALSIPHNIPESETKVEIRTKVEGKNHSIIIPIHINESEKLVFANEITDVYENNGNIYAIYEAAEDQQGVYFFDGSQWSENLPSLCYELIDNYCHYLAEDGEHHYRTLPDTTETYFVQHPDGRPIPGNNQPVHHVDGLREGWNDMLFNITTPEDYIEFEVPEEVGGDAVSPHWWYYDEMNGRLYGTDLAGQLPSYVVYDTEEKAFIQEENAESKSKIKRTFLSHQPIGMDPDIAKLSSGELALLTETLKTTDEDGGLQRKHITIIDEDFNVLEERELQKEAIAVTADGSNLKVWHSDKVEDGFSLYSETIKR